MKKLLTHLSIAAFTVVTLFSVQAHTAAAGEDPNFQWPAEGPITATFHDEDYFLKKYFQHSGIDIGLAQGTEVRVAAKGKVMALKKPKDDAYSYVIINHKNGHATLYGHLSRLDVKKHQKVERGDVIGLSGGLPGTPGAGNYSTGAHLHFEIRENGIPMNPLDYLPESN